MGKQSRQRDYEKKEKMKEYMKDKEWLSLSVISKDLGIHYNKAELLMRDLLNSKEVESEVRGSYTFWRLKND